MICGNTHPLLLWLLFVGRRLLALALVRSRKRLRVSMKMLKYVKRMSASGMKNEPIEEYTT